VVEEKLNNLVIEVGKLQKELESFKSSKDCHTGIRGCSAAALLLGHAKKVDSLIKPAERLNDIIFDDNDQLLEEKIPEILPALVMVLANTQNVLILSLKECLSNLEADASKNKDEIVQLEKRLEDISQNLNRLLIAGKHGHFYRK
jgi:adenylosuccinate synthase